MSVSRIKQVANNTSLSQHEQHLSFWETSLFCTGSAQWEQLDVGLQNRRWTGTTSKVLSAYINKNKVHISLWYISWEGKRKEKCQTELWYGTQLGHWHLILKVNQIEKEGEVTKKRHAPFLNSLLIKLASPQYSIHAPKYDGLKKKLKAYHIHIYITAFYNSVVRTNLSY